MSIIACGHYFDNTGSAQFSMSVGVAAKFQAFPASCHSELVEESLSFRPKGKRLQRNRAVALCSRTLYGCVRRARLADSASKLPPVTLVIVSDDDGRLKIRTQRHERFQFHGRNTKRFRARLNPDLHTVVWSNGADMSPDFLYEIGQPVKALPRSVRGKRPAAHHVAESHAKYRAKR